MDSEYRTYTDSKGNEYAYRLDIKRNFRHLLTFTVHYEGESESDGNEYWDTADGWRSMHVMANTIFLRILYKISEKEDKKNQSS